MSMYDVLIYHDLSDPFDEPVRVGDPGGKLGFPDLQVVAIGPGIHEGRTTVVLSHGPGAMDEIQALLNRLHDR